MPKKIYKELINYSCVECLKSFGNRKDYYQRHINRKNPCIKIPNPIAPEAPPIAPEAPPIAPEAPPIAPKEALEQADKLEEISICIEKSEYNYSCEYCNQIFSKKYNLTRHQDNRCKKKGNKISISKTESETNTDINTNDNKLNLILERLKILENENDKLKKEINKNKSNVCISQSNYNINVINNNNNNIINFNDMNYNNIDKKIFTGPILDRRLFGKAIILKMIENIYINESYREYQNLVITDKNRGYVKVYNNGKWKTDNLNIINFVVDGIVEHSKSILDELYDIYLDNNQAINRLNTSKKYINLCDNEYLEELKEERVDNKKEIKRCEEFRDMIFKDTINLFHDNKNILLKPKKNISLINL